MLGAVELNLTDVLIALIAGIPAIIAAVASAIVLYRTKTPSGDRIGHVVERTEHLSAVDVGLTRSVAKKVDAVIPDGHEPGGAVESGRPNG